MVSLGSGYRLCQSCYEAAGALFTIRREKRPPGAASACCRCSPRARNGSACALPTSPAGPAGTVKITMIGSSVAAGRMVDNLLDRAAGESRPALSRPGGDAASGSVRSRGRDGRGAAGSVQVCSSARLRRPRPAATHRAIFGAISPGRVRKPLLEKPSNQASKDSRLAPSGPKDLACFETWFLARPSDYRAALTIRGRSQP